MADLLSIRKVLKDFLHPDILIGTPVPVSGLQILKPYLLEKAGLTQDASVIMMAVPYYTTYCDMEHNVSVYSISEDYHRFFKAMFEGLSEKLKAECPDLVFSCFADHSPIAEVGAAVKSGLGVIGKNHLLITKEYGSYVFLGELIVELPCPEPVIPAQTECINCGKCKEVCSVHIDMSECLSALSQKKGELSEAESRRIQDAPLLWGCDICQSVCPMNRYRKYSEIPFFQENAIPELSKDLMDQMTDEAFQKRAFSWRGRAVPERNMKIREDADKEQTDKKGGQDA